MTADLGESLDWDTNEIEDSEEFVLLDAGVYPFMVVSMKRERFEGSEKIGPCPKAVLGLTLDTPNNGLITIYENLLLNTKMQFKIAQFFKSIGNKVDPETNKVAIDWNNLEGRCGKLELEVREYTKRDGSLGQSNNVKKFLEPQEREESQSPYQAPSTPVTQTSMDIPAQPPAKQPNNTHWGI